MVKERLPRIEYNTKLRLASFTVSFLVLLKEYHNRHGMNFTQPQSAHDHHIQPFTDVMTGRRAKAPTNVVFRTKFLYKTEMYDKGEM